MGTSPEKRFFIHQENAYTVTVWSLPDPPNRFTVHVSRAPQGAAQAGEVGQRTYIFAQFRHKLSPTEQQPMMLDLLAFAEKVIRNGEMLPDDLPEDWSRQLG